MDETQRKVLRDCHVDLVRDLEPKFVLDLLYQDGILTDNDLEIIQAEKSARGRCQVLLSMLPTRGPTAYGSFQRALRETNYSHLGAILDKTEKRQILKNGNSASKTFLSGDTISDKNKSDVNTASICGVCKNFLETKLKPRINDSVLQGILRKHCCLFTHNIEPRELIDEFYQQLLLDDDQYERVRTAVTRRDRCEIFFAEVITYSSDHVLAVLTKSLEKKYMYIVKEIHRTIGSKENVSLLRSEQLHVLTKLAKDDTTVKAVDNENVFQDETVEANRSGRQEDVPKDVTMHGHGLLDRFMDYSSIGKNMNATEDKENNGDDDLETTRQKVIAHSDNFKMPVSNWDGGYVDVHPIDYNTPKKYNMVNASCTSGQCIEKNDGKLDNFSKLITKELATRTKTCSKCLDKPDGMFMKKSHFNNYYDEAKCSKSYTQSTTDIAENKNCKIKQHQVSEREISENREKKYSMTKTNGKTKPTTTGMNSSVTKSDTIDNDVSDVVKDKFQISRLGASCPVEPSKKLTFAFNHLSTLINEGNFEKFDILSQRLQDKFPTDYDMLCIVGYLKTSRDLFLTNFDSAKHKINSTLEFPKTSNPRYFTLELFTAKTRMYITQKKLEKLQSTLDDAMMILETDPVGCTGRAAGWLYINDARNQTAKLSVLNLSKPNALKIYEQFYERAKTSFKRSMTNFKNDGGKDGPFGFGYALCRLVILLLRCGDNGMTMNSLTPLREDVNAAEQYLKNLEDSEIVMAKILEMHFRLAKCDYYFRRENNVRALEHAEAAYNLASDLKLLEFTEHAQNRLKFLQSRTKLKVIELDDDEVNNILYGESTETASSQSDY